MRFIRNLIASIQLKRLVRAERAAWRRHDARTDAAGLRFVRHEISQAEMHALISASVDVLCAELNELGWAPEPYDHSLDEEVTLADLAF